MPGEGGSSVCFVGDIVARRVLRISIRALRRSLSGKEDGGDMIHIVCANPAVDRTVRVEDLRPGAVLRAVESHSMAGGKGVNVARFLREMDPDIEMRLFGFLGGESAGFIRREADRLGIEDGFTPIAGETRICTTLLDRRGSTVVNEPGPTVSDVEVQAFLDALHLARAPEIAVISGSLPGTAPKDLYREVVRIYRAKGVPVFLDASGEALRNGLAARPKFVKPNEEEFWELVGIEKRSGGRLGEIAAAAKEVLRTGPESLAVSLGERGLLAVFSDGAAAVFPVLPVEAVNTVGCGDALLAGTVYGAANGLSLAESLAWGTAAAAMNAESAIPHLREPGRLSEWVKRVKPVGLGDSSAD